MPRERVTETDLAEFIYAVMTKELSSRALDDEEDREAAAEALAKRLVEHCLILER